MSLRCIDSPVFVESRLSFAREGDVREEKEDIEETFLSFLFYSSF